MLFLVFYLWGVIGVQCFGGQLYDYNTRFNTTKNHDLDAVVGDDGYFASNYQALNFNDMLMSFVTFFNWMLVGYIQPVCDIIVGLYEPWSVPWFAAYFYTIG